MRKVKNLPRTDIEQFNAEVLARGVQATLPRNLSDKWLRLICRDFSYAQKAEIEGLGETNVDLSTPTLVVLALLANKRNCAHDNLSVPEREIMDGLGAYQQAVEEEILGRETGVFRVQFTLGNIV